MRLLESLILQSVDAANNPKYYNRSNGGGKGVDSVFDIDIIYQKIINKQFPIVKTPVSELIKLKRLQVRMEDDPKHARNITDTINADLGNTDNYLIHVFQEWNPNEKVEEVIKWQI